MKKKILALLLSVLLCGCQSLPTNPVGSETELAELTLAIPVGSGEICYEVAQELARRAVDFAGNTLNVTIVMEENIWGTLEDGQVDLIVCENSRLVSDAEKIGKLQYPPVPSLEQSEKSEEVVFVRETQLTGEAAMMAMLEYPYFFRDQDCVIRGANDGDFLAALNHDLAVSSSMQLKRLSSCGIYHWLSNDSEALDEYLMEHTEEEVLQQQLVNGRNIRQPWDYIGDIGVYLREMDVTDEAQSTEGDTILLSGGRQMLLDIFLNPKTMEKLAQKQKAAIEEAIVYSGGYSCTLAGSRLKQALDSHQEAGVVVEKVAVDPWYEAFQELYLSGGYEVNPELVELLQKKTERFH